MEIETKILLAQQLNEQMAPLSLVGRISLIGEKFPKAVFTTSLGLEDQVVTWAIAAIAQQTRSIRIATLRTGRLFLTTVKLLAKTKKHFALDIIEYAPDANELKDYLKKYSLNGFYESKQARLACCFVRKIAPLKRALSGADAWVTGLRKEQSVNRSNIVFAQYDSEYNLIKLNPLADLSLAELTKIISENNIPINPLHKKNYPSIGCEPCTRAIKQGEDERAGRWWWEKDDKRECGLHLPQSAPSPISIQHSET